MIINKLPVGWNIWNAFGHIISDQLTRESANAFTSLGLTITTTESINGFKALKAVDPPLRLEALLMKRPDTSYISITMDKYRTIHGVCQGAGLLGGYKDGGRSRLFFLQKYSL